MDQGQGHWSNIKTFLSLKNIIFPIVSGKLIQRRWKSLKEGFRKEMQLQKGKSGDGASKRRKYLYFDQLLFLTSTLQKRETTGNYSAPITDEEEPDNEEYEGNPTNLCEPTRPPKEKKSKTNVKQNYEQQLVEVLKSKANEQIDDDKLFFASLVPEFKKLKDDQKIDVKIELLQVIKRAQKSHQRSSENGSSVPLNNVFQQYNAVPYMPHTVGPHSAQGSLPVPGPSCFQRSCSTPSPVPTQGHVSRPINPGSFPTHVHMSTSRSLADQGHSPSQGYIHTQGLSTNKTYTTLQSRSDPEISESLQFVPGTGTIINVSSPVSDTMSGMSSEVEQYD